MVYVLSFVPLTPLLVKSATLGSDSAYQSFVNSLLKKTGIFANNASETTSALFLFTRPRIKEIHTIVYVNHKGVLQPNQYSEAFCSSFECFYASNEWINREFSLES